MKQSFRLPILLSAVLLLVAALARVVLPSMTEVISHDIATETQTAATGEHRDDPQPDTQDGVTALPGYDATPPEEDSQSPVGVAEQEEEPQASMESPEPSVPEPSSGGYQPLPESVPDYALEGAAALPEYNVQIPASSSEPEPDLDPAYDISPVLEANEAIVTDFAALRSALQNNNGITTVYFGANITGLSGGVMINPNKTSIVISGINPTTPNQTEPYTFSEYSSATFTDTIYINSNNTLTKDVVLRDINIIGRNYYGTVSVYDIANTDGTRVTYERVNYSGPQLVHNRRNGVHFVDCYLDINGRNGGSTGQEVGEASQYIFEGENTIICSTTSTSMFWFPYRNHLFEVLPDSSLTCSRTSASPSYHTMYSDGQPIAIRVGERARLKMTMPNGMLHNYSYNLFEIKAGGSFDLTVTGSPSVDVIPMSGPINIEAGASFVANCTSSASHCVIAQSGGDVTVGQDATFQISASGSYGSLIELNNCTFACDDPASVLLSNGGRPIAADSTAGRLSWAGQQINYWQAQTAGSLDNKPLYHWAKGHRNRHFTLSGTIATGSSGNIGAITTNYETGDLPPETPPAPATFNLIAARVLALGKLDLILNTVSTSSTSVHGVASPGATVRVTLLKGGIATVLADVSADHDGIFTAAIPTGYPLDASVIVKADAAFQYLYADDSTNVIELGNVELIVPSQLQFMTTELSAKDEIIGRLDADWHIVVSDTHALHGEWSVYAQEIVPLTPQTPGRPALAPVVFVSGGTTVSMDSKTLIYTHTGDTGDELTVIGWPANQGILARIPRGAAYTNERYTGVIEWTIQNAP